ncbi:1-acyl-sn-glycerol-3-phosphate acyltransferase [Geodermatophilus sp. DSM 44513]|uniref:lysophospholipid acyltransferase family protein n=1 Tax=Geodermatophilus sp. DSM 44513 TaxID=1528104 RepID=UPI001271584A|nr:lysophospholipid acyltransferase family protein [Geodermatophilus sp. DSM 44513]WNV74517.1 lysophospholipid acyltransferase family protein [Geodermatophilus sp. DSM 44513]
MTQHGTPDAGGAGRTPAAPSRWRTRRPLPPALLFCVLVVYPLTVLLFRMRIRHAERFPRTGPVLVVANHVSVLDPLACARLVWECGRVPHFLAKEAVFAGPAGRLLRAAGQIPVARGSADARASLAAAEADLAAGNVVVIYPEGSVTRDPDWWPMEARTGVARLALATDAVVLPVAQWGPQRVHDYHTKRLHPQLRAPADHLVGEPVDLTDLRADVRAGRPMTGDLLRQVTDRVMTRVRDQLAELRGEPAPPTTTPHPRRVLPGDLPGSPA